MGTTSSSYYNANELTGYEPLVDSKESLKTIQLQAISLGISPLIGAGHNSKLELDPEVKKAMKDKQMMFTFKRSGTVKRYCKRPKSRKMLEKQIKRNERRRNEIG